MLTYNCNYNIYNKHNHSYLIYLSYILYIIIVYQIFITYTSVNNIDTLGANFRAAYYDSEIHGTSIGFVLYEQIAIPVGIFIISYWVCKRMKGGLWFFCTTVFFLLDALIKLGRFPLYFYVFFIIIGHYIGTYRQKTYIVIPITVTIVALSVYMVIARQSFIGEVDQDMIMNIFDKAVLKYHVAGFYVLDKLKDSNVFKTCSIIPYYTFGYIQYIMSIIYRRFDIHMEYPQQIFNLTLADSIDTKIGVYNAFSTNLLPIYLDGGIPFCIIIYFLLGFLFRARFNTQYLFLSPINIIVLFVMIFGIFQPIIITSYFYIPILLSCMLSKE